MGFSEPCKTRSLLSIVPYQFLRTAATSQTASLQHFSSEVSQGCQRKNLFSRSVYNIHTPPLCLGIFSHVGSSKERSDGHNTVLQCEFCTRHEMLLSVSCSVAVTFIESYNRLIKYTELKGAHKDHWVQLLALHRSTTRIIPCS